MHNDGQCDIGHNDYLEPLPVSKKQFDNKLGVDSTNMFHWNIKPKAKLAH